MDDLFNLYRVDDFEIEKRLLADFAENDYIPERESPSLLAEEYILVGGKDMRLVDALNDNIITGKEFKDILIQRGITLEKSILKELLVKLLP